MNYYLRSFDTEMVVEHFGGLIIGVQHSDSQLVWIREGQMMDGVKAKPLFLA